MMRRVAVATVCLTLTGCANFEQPLSAQSAGTAPIVDSENLRVVMHQPVTVDPLVAEPGDIWADLLSKQPAPVLTQRAQATPRRAPIAASHPPTRAAEPPSSTVAAKTDSPRQPPVASQPAATQHHFAVQLTAASSETAALAHWRRLQRKLPQLISGRAPAVIMAEIDGRSLWRLRTGAFSNRAEANAFCTRIQTEHAQCWVVLEAS